MKKALAALSAALLAVILMVVGPRLIGGGAPSATPHADNTFRVTRLAPGSPARYVVGPISGDGPPPDARVLPRDAPASARYGERRAPTDLELARENDEPIPDVFPIDADGLRDAVRSRMDELQACYDTLLASYPDAAGKVVVTFAIDGSGKVVGADLVEDSLDSVYLSGCLTTVMQELQFEPHSKGGDTTVTWPFTFRSEP